MGASIASLITVVLMLPGVTRQPEPKVWDFSAAAYGYVLPEESNYIQPTITADRDWLHLEARYNYEGLKTGSAWVGWNLSFGETVTFDVTPMFGGVFGDTAGVAPGYRASLGWRALELSSEGEYVFDLRESTDSYFYTWSEVSISLTDWLRVGLATQRTRAYESDRDIQRGFFAGFSSRHVDFTAYVFNPDDSDPIVVLTLGVNFSIPRRR